MHNMEIEEGLDRHWADLTQEGGTSDPWDAEGEQQCDDAAFDCEEAGEGGEGQGQGNHWELESERVDVCR